MLSLTCLHSKNQVCSSFSGACQSKCQPTQLCSTEGRILSDGYPWSRAKLQQIANDINSAVQGVKGMQNKGAASCIQQGENGFGYRNWVSGFLLFRAILVLAGLTRNSQHWLWFTGVLPILLLIIAVFYQAQKWICISYQTMLNYFLNQSRNVKIWYTSC